MKTVFWIIGVPCSGKSNLAKLLSEKVNIPFIHLDCSYDYGCDCLEDKKKSYIEIFKTINQNVYIIDGIIPFHFEIDMNIIKDILKDTRIIYVIVNPIYEQYVLNCEKRKTEKNDTEILSEIEYLKETKRFKDIAKRYIEICNENDLNKITAEDIRSINYQHLGFTNLKWEQLKINCEGKSILDLGCSSCYYEIFAKKNGAIKYTGLDVNMAYLFNENAHLFDLNELNKWNEPADIVISTSVYHYIGDKEKFIKHASRLTKETFIFETPLSKLSGRLIECEPNRNLLFTTKELLEFWISKYFKSFECLGESIVEDASYRLIYHCKK